MTRKLLLGCSIVLVLAMVAAGLWTGLSLPGDAHLPVHWDARWRPDTFMPKWRALMIPPLFAAAMLGLIAGLTRIEPRRDDLARSLGLVHAVWAAMILILGACDLLIVSAAWGTRVAGPRLMTGVLGLALAVIGNQFGKSRPMRLVGIRTPWTLADPDVWVATHRLAGKLMVAAGLIWCAAALGGLTGPRAMPLLVALMVAAALAPAAYSCLLWRRRSAAA